MGHRLSRWLADACALIGFYTADPTLPATVRTILEAGPETVGVAATTVWEIAIKTARGKLVDIRVGGHVTLAGMLRAHGFDLVPFDPASTEQAVGLPRLFASIERGEPLDRPDRV